MAFTADHWSSATTASLGDKRLRMFSGCNYLGLAHHPVVVAAAQAGLLRHGIASNGSPLTTGKVTAHAQLEAQLAAFVEQPKAVLVPDGHLANVAACQGLVGAEPTLRTAFVDESAHDSLVAAARAAGLTVQRYRHADAEHAAELCHEVGSAALVMSDSLFGASGQLCPVATLLQCLPENATLLLDDGHGLGVLGPGGRGAFAAWRVSEAQHRARARVVLTASLSKGLGCYGGVVASDSALIDSIQRSAGAYGGTTPIPPAIAEATLTALALLARDTSLVERLRQNAERVRSALIELGQRAPAAGVPIFSLALDAERSARLQQQFEHAELGVPLVSYAGGPGQQYFRISISAQHTEHDLESLIGALRAGLAG
jgi:8-amino-7-oxononanoate synthase